MGRPLNGTCESLPDGRCKASLPVQRGEKKRKTHTFRDAAAARAWIAEGVVALHAGQNLPDPELYDRPRAATGVAVALPAGYAIREVAYAYHELRYVQGQKAQLKRSDAVLADINNHILPYFDVVRLNDIASVTPVHVTGFARFLGGWSLDNADECDPQNPRRMEKSTASRILGILKYIMQFAVANGYRTSDPSAGASALEPYGGSKTHAPGALLSYRECALIATFLSVVHQLVLWMERGLGLRQGEAFGVLVGDVADLGDYGLLAVRRQGGQWEHVRNERGQRERVSSKDQTKTSSSTRVIYVPPAIMAIIRIVVAAFHTDPDTGEIDATARLVPGVQNDDESGKGNFAIAFKKAARRAGFGDEDVLTRVQPHHLRRSLATTLECDEILSSLFRRRFVGHRVGTDVYSEHYVLDDPRHRKMKEIATAVEDEILGELGTLIVPTAVRPQWGLETRARQRLDYIDTLLALHGWQVDTVDGEDPWLTSTQVAALVGEHESKARQKMRDGTIPATKHQWGTREIWKARREDVLVYRAQQDERLELKAVAAQLGISYHQAYETLRRLDLQPQQRPAERSLLVTDEHVEALRAEHERIRKLRQRAMPIREAAKLLRRSDRTVRGWTSAGRAELDPETDASGDRFVTRRWVEQELARSQPATTPRDPEESTFTLSRVAELIGVSRKDVKHLTDSGVLVTVTVARAQHVTRESLIRWATGYRPDLLPVFRVGP